MFCEKCGGELKEGAVFCTHCGARVTKDPQEQAPAQTPAPAQGQTPTQTPAPSQEPTPTQEQAPAEKPVREKKPRRRGTVILVSCLSAVAVLLIALIVFFVVRGRQEQAAWEDYTAQSALWLDEMEAQASRLVFADGQEPEYSRMVAELRAGLAQDAGQVDREALEAQKAALTALAQTVQEDNEAQIAQLRAQVESMDLSGAIQADVDQLAQYGPELDSFLAAGEYRQALSCVQDWQVAAELAVTPREDYTLRVTQYDLSSYPTVRLYLDVTDQSGSFVSGLDQSAFYVNEGRTVDGPLTRRTVLRAAQINENTGLSLGLIADVSGSMSGDMAQLRQSMIRFMGTIQFGKGDEVELVEFADSSYICNSFTSSASELTASINAMSADGMTRLYDTLISEIERIASRDNAKCVIAFTDGYDNRSLYTAQDVIQRAQASRVPVFLVGVGQGCDESTLRTIAESTGGFYRSIDDIGGLQSVYGAIYREAKELYLVEYTVADEDNFDDGCYPHIQVRAQNGQGGHLDDFSFQPGDFFSLMYNKFLVAGMDCQTKGERNLLDSGLITTSPEAYANPNCVAYQSQAAIDTGGVGSHSSSIYEVLTYYNVLDVQKDGAGYVVYGECHYNVSQERPYRDIKNSMELDAIHSRYGADIDPDTRFWTEKSVYNYEKLTLIRDTDGRWKFDTRVYERQDGGKAYGTLAVRQAIQR